MKSWIRHEGYILVELDYAVCQFLWSKREVAEAVFAKEQGKHGPKNIMTELEEVKVFYDAEEHHQQVSESAIN